MRFVQTFLKIGLLVLMAHNGQAQAPEYVLDVTKAVSVHTEPIAIKGENPQGLTLSVNSRYFEKNGKPWFPLMGEFHYVRYPHQYWEEELLKMKAAGISIVATYVFWNAHEYPKGVWNWSGDRDLKNFISLCKKHGLFVWLRCGPWSHGEQLYGGFPLWIEQMKNTRSNNPAYLSECENLFAQIGEQTKGLYFSEGGPIIGAQLENEYGTGQQGHITALKAMAQRNGIRPVFFSITANTVFDDKNFEALPLQGGYPYRGWETGGGGPTKDFLYANDQWILTADLGKLYYDTEKYPRGLCEQGAGSQMTYDNRFTVEPYVVEAHLQNQIGRGMNLVGYYMFHGGTQMPGLKEPGLPESYDFQAPLDEFGLPGSSYKSLKLLHHFINDFGTELAAMNPVQPAIKVLNERDTDTLRYIGRFTGNSGYVFLNNTQVRVPQPDKIFTLQVKLNGENIRIPASGNLVLKGQTTAILPVNMNESGVNIRYATAQPLAKFEHNGHAYLFFTEVPGMQTEILLDAAGVKRLDVKEAKMERKESSYFISFSAGKPGRIDITKADDKQLSVIVLTRQQAENSWRTALNGNEYLFLSNADIMVSGNNIELRQLENPVMQFSVIPSLPKTPVASYGKLVTQKSLFDNYRITLKKASPVLQVKKYKADSVFVYLPKKFDNGTSDLFLTIDYTVEAQNAGSITALLRIIFTMGHPGRLD
ncbi:MAG: beta-galactosidase [Bacteroidota bacterium]